MPQEMLSGWSYKPIGYMGDPFQVAESEREALPDDAKFFMLRAELFEKLGKGGLETSRYAPANCVPAKQNASTKLFEPLPEPESPGAPLEASAFAPGPSSAPTKDIATKRDDPVRAPEHQSTADGLQSSGAAPDGAAVVAQKAEPATTLKPQSAGGGLKASRFARTTSTSVCKENTPVKPIKPTGGGLAASRFAPDTSTTSVKQDTPAKSITIPSARGILTTSHSAPDTSTIAIKQDTSAKSFNIPIVGGGFATFRFAPDTSVSAIAIKQDTSAKTAEPQSTANGLTTSRFAPDMTSTAIKQNVPAQATRLPNTDDGLATSHFASVAKRDVPEQIKKVQSTAGGLSTSRFAPGTSVIDVKTDALLAQTIEPHSRKDGLRSSVRAQARNIIVNAAKENAVTNIKTKSGNGKSYKARNDKGLHKSLENMAPTATKALVVVEAPVQPATVVQASTASSATALVEIDPTVKINAIVPTGTSTDTKRGLKSSMWSNNNACVNAVDDDSQVQTNDGMTTSSFTAEDVKIIAVEERAIKQSSTKQVLAKVHSVEDNAPFPAKNVMETSSIATSVQTPIQIKDSSSSIMSAGADVPINDIKGMSAVVNGGLATPEWTNSGAEVMVDQEAAPKNVTDKEAVAKEKSPKENAPTQSGQFDAKPSQDTRNGTPSSKSSLSAEAAVFTPPNGFKHDKKKRHSGSTFTTIASGDYTPPHLRKKASDPFICDAKAMKILEIIQHVQSAAAMPPLQVFSVMTEPAAGSEKGSDDSSPSDPVSNIAVNNQRDHVSGSLTENVDETSGQDVCQLSATTCQDVVTADQEVVTVDDYVPPHLRIWTEPVAMSATKDHSDDEPVLTSSMAENSEITTDQPIPEKQSNDKPVLASSLAELFGTNKSTQSAKASYNTFSQKYSGVPALSHPVKQMVPVESDANISTKTAEDRQPLTREGSFEKDRDGVGAGSPVPNPSNYFGLVNQSQISSKAMGKKPATEWRCAMDDVEQFREAYKKEIAGVGLKEISKPTKEAGLKMVEPSEKKLAHSSIDRLNDDGSLYVKYQPDARNNLCPIATELLDWNGGLTAPPCDWEQGRPFNDQFMDTYIREWSADLHETVTQVDLKAPEYSSGRCMIVHDKFGKPVEHPDAFMNTDQSENLYKQRIQTADIETQRRLRRAARVNRSLLKSRIANASLAPSAIWGNVRLNPHTPTVPTYMRPAEAKDIPQITEIYNHYILNSIIPEDQTVITANDMLNFLTTTNGSTQPFIVAVRDELASTGRGRNAEMILGFAYTKGQTGIGGGYMGRSRHTSSIHVYVHPEHRRKRVGSCLMDGLLTITSQTYRPKDGCAFVNTNKDSAYERVAGCGPPRYNKIRVELPSEVKDDSDLPWIQTWLKKFSFEKTGCNEGSALSTGTNGKSIRLLNVVLFEVLAASNTTFADTS